MIELTETGLIGEKKNLDNVTDIYHTNNEEFEIFSFLRCIFFFLDSPFVIDKDLNNFHTIDDIYS